MKECIHELNLTFHADLDVYYINVFTCTKCGETINNRTVRNYSSFLNTYQGNEEPRKFYERRLKELNLEEPKEKRNDR